MSDGEILQAATYHDLLTSCKDFQDLVNAHRETAGYFSYELVILMGFVS